MSDCRGAVVRILSSFNKCYSVSKRGKRKGKYLTIFGCSIFLLEFKVLYSVTCQKS